MTSYSKMIKDLKEKDTEFFFGEISRISNKYFTFKHEVSDDQVTIITNNVKFIKGNPVLLVDNNKGVYLKDWAVRKVHNYDEYINAHAVKLNRNFFKTYTFSFDFEGFSFDREQTFDDMVAAAKAQDLENMKIAEGWMN